tara:strand:- start:2290 stop:2745 length:456 start_codon:yes stop_codon:yes gene_type:complete
MLNNIPQDCLEIILKYSDIQTYYYCQLLNKCSYDSIRQVKLNTYFAKNRLEKIYSTNCIKFCTNSQCPNKLHMGDTVITVLKEKELDVDLIMEYKNIFCSQRIDKTITYEFINLKNILKIPNIPYCEDCLIEYNSEMYEFLEKKNLFIIEQ